MQAPRAMRYLTVAVIGSCLLNTAQADAGQPCRASSPKTRLADAGAAANNPQLTPYQTAIQELRELGQVIHHIHQSSNDLASEVSQPFDMMGEIDIIGGQVIPIMPATAEGFGPTQYLPPRKKYLDLYMSHLGNLLPLLNDEINTLVVPADAQQTISPMVAKMKSWAGDIQQNYAALQPMVAGPKFINNEIRTRADAITDTTKALEKMRRDIYKEMKRDEKTAEGK